MPIHAIWCTRVISADCSEHPNPLSSPMMIEDRGNQKGRHRKREREGAGFVGTNGGTGADHWRQMRRESSEWVGQRI